MDTQNLNPAAYGVCMRASSRMSKYSTIEINVLNYFKFQVIVSRNSFKVIKGLEKTHTDRNTKIGVR